MSRPVLDLVTARRWAMTARLLLGAAREQIDALNVFPVPDGDTGTNLVLTMRRAAHEVAVLPADAPVGQILAALARGALMGARGNSGIITSQLLLGWAQAWATAPTASAVMGDICDLARGSRVATFGQAAQSLEAVPAATNGVPAPYYLRMQLLDRPGSLAKVAGVLADAGISIHRMRQYDHGNGSAPVLILTHQTTPDAIAHAIAGLPGTGVVEGEPVELRIERL
mgnify:CR=1 FL=1